MKRELLPSLSDQLASAHQIVETVVLRVNQGAVFTVDIGEPLMANSTLGAKVTLLTNPPTHIGVCESKSIDKVWEAAQGLITNAISQGILTKTTSQIPKPHFDTVKATA